MIYKNVFYFADINAIGGVETMFWNLARKYGKTHDILIIYRTGDPAQIERLQKYVHVKKYYGQHITCERAFFNFDTSPIETIDAKEYSVILHSDYHARKIYPPEHRKITRYIGGLPDLEAMIRQSDKLKKVDFYLRQNREEAASSSDS